MSLFLICLTPKLVLKTTNYSSSDHLKWNGYKTYKGIKFYVESMRGMLWDNFFSPLELPPSSLTHMTDSISHFPHVYGPLNHYYFTLLCFIFTSPSRYTWFLVCRAKPPLNGIRPTFSPLLQFKLYSLLLVHFYATYSTSVAFSHAKKSKWKENNLKTNPPFLIAQLPPIWWTASLLPRIQAPLLLHSKFYFASPH